MSQLTIKLSDKADALIAQLQKEIFNRRRKKVSPAGVVETLVESGAKSQSDKRFATSWTNLIADIEKAAKAANAHGSKPANLTDAEWALILSHRSRATTRKSSAKPAAKAPARKPAARTATATSKAKAAVAKTATKTTAETAVKAAKPVVKAAPKAAVKSTAARAKPRTAARNPIRKSAVSDLAVKPAASGKPAARSAVRRKAQPSAAANAGTSSVARRMAKAVSRLSAGGAVAPSTPSSNGAAPLVEVG